MTVRATRPALVAIVTLALAGCADTVVDAPTTTTAPATTTVDAADPLVALSLQTAMLSATLIDNDGQTEALARIERIWAGLRPEIEADRPELVDEFDTVFDLLRRSVERRRPADADKAHKNLLVLIDAYSAPS